MTCGTNLITTQLFIVIHPYQARHPLWKLMGQQGNVGQVVEDQILIPLASKVGQGSVGGSKDRDLAAEEGLVQAIHVHQFGKLRG